MKRGAAQAWWAVAIAVGAVGAGASSCETTVVSLTGPDECSSYLCAAGSALCCPSARRGVWSSAGEYCSCPSGSDGDDDGEGREYGEVPPDGSPCYESPCRTSCLAAGFRDGICATPYVCECLPWPGDGGADGDADGDDGEHLDVRDIHDSWPDPDGCTSEMGGVCNAVLQCGCAAGERCILGAELVEECVPAGTAPIDSLCGDSPDDCVAQNQCFGTGTMDQRCRQFCYEDTDCPAEYLCADEVAGVTAYRVCRTPPDSCDVFTGTGCPTGEACIIDPTPSTHPVECAAAGTGEPGVACDGVGDCRIGTACYTTDGATYLCYEYCDLAATAHPCPAGLACGSFGHPTIGVCNAE